MREGPGRVAVHAFVQRIEPDELKTHRLPAALSHVDKVSVPVLGKLRRTSVRDTKSGVGGVPKGPLRFEQTIDAPSVEW